MRNLILAVAAVIAVCSCKSQYEMLLNSNDADAKYEAAFEYFNNGKYTKASSLFESLAMLTEGTERDDTVRYYWGLSNYKSKDYYTADTNFEKFLESYPRSPFASEARYLRLDCLYLQTLRYELDQTPTYKAMNEISEYILEYPSSSHIATCRDMLIDLGERLDREAGRHLDMWVVCYEHNLDDVPNIAEYLNEFDVISFWTWRGSELCRAERNIERVRAIAPTKRIMAGMYMWNYGEHCALTREQMEYQAQLYLRLMRAGEIEGIVVCSNCIADLGIECVEYTRAWIEAHKDEVISSS